MSKNITFEGSEKSLTGIILIMIIPLIALQYAFCSIKFFLTLEDFNINIIRIKRREK